jgi:hypothetical protein
MRRPPSCGIGPERTSSFTLAFASRRGLVHPLVAPKRGLGANVGVGADVLELEVVRLEAKLGRAYLVLGLAGDDYALDVSALIGVVACAGDLGGLVPLAALGFLLEVLEAITAEVVVIAEPIEVEVVAIEA